MNKIVRAAALYAVVATCSLYCQAIPRPERFNRDLYWVSVASLVAANVADVATSVTAGGRELNPLVAGSSAKLVAVKSGLVAGTLLIEYFVIRHHPERMKLFSWINIGASAGVGVVAWHNTTVR